MQLENEFTVPASIDQAWAVLLDVPRVAPCLPGATVEDGGGDEGEYKGQMKIKIGPITACYKGTVKIQEADEAAHRVAMRAQAKDARGQGTAAATITSTMEEVADGTKITVVTDMRVTGPAAQFGRGVMQDVSAKLMTRFAECLAEQMQASPDVETDRRGAPPRPRPRPRARAETETAAPTAESAEASTKVEDTGVPGASSGVSSAEAEGGPERLLRPVLRDHARGRRTTSWTSARRAATRCSSAPCPLIGGVVALLILLRLIRR